MTKVSEIMIIIKTVRWGQ